MMGERQKKELMRLKSTLAESVKELEAIQVSSHLVCFASLHHSLHNSFTILPPFTSFFINVLQFFHFFTIHPPYIHHTFTINSPPIHPSSATHQVDKRRLLMESEGRRLEALATEHQQKLLSWKNELPDRKKVL